MQPEANHTKRSSKTAEAKASALRKATETRTPAERMAFALYLGRRGRKFAELARRKAEHDENA